MQILQFPENSWGLTVLKNISLRFTGLKGLKMVWEKSSLIWIFPWYWLKTPCFPLISLTGKSLQNFPWFPWSVGTLRKILHFNTARSHCDGNIIFLQIFFCAVVSLQCEHLHLLPWDPFFFCSCHHNWEQNPFHDDIKIMKLLPLPQ